MPSRQFVISLVIVLLTLGGSPRFAPVLRMAIAYPLSNRFRTGMTIAIFAGVVLLERLSWLLFVFGGLLIFTAFRVATHTAEDIHPERNPVIQTFFRGEPCRG